MAEVARIPRDALMVTLMGLAISCDHTDAYLYLAQRLKSGWLVMMFAYIMSVKRFCFKGRPC